MNYSGEFCYVNELACVMGRSLLGSMQFHDSFAFSIKWDHRYQALWDILNVDPIRYIMFDIFSFLIITLRHYRDYVCVLVVQ